MVEINGDMVKLDKPTKEIHIYTKISNLRCISAGATITKVKQDKLNRVYITVTVV